MHAIAAPKAVIHPLLVRICHWVNVLAIFIMMFSGWRIYNAAPVFPAITFPQEWTLGGWHAGSIQWHFAGMWLLALNGLAYVGYGILAGHWRRHFFPLRIADVRREIGNLLRLKVSHEVGVYNVFQKSAYLGVVLMLVAIVLSGAAIWKPVQLWWLAGAMGGYEGARIVHFLAMAGIAGFVLIHVMMVALVPSTLPPMFTGRAWRSPAGGK
jgi:thiosulfate reductase cytochrome b subunit